MAKSCNVDSGDEYVKRSGPTSFNGSYSAAYQGKWDPLFDPEEYCFFDKDDTDPFLESDKIPLKDREKERRFENVISVI